MCHQSYHQLPQGSSLAQVPPVHADSWPCTSTVATRSAERGWGGEGREWCWTCRHSNEEDDDSDGDNIDNWL